MSLSACVGVWSLSSFLMFAAKRPFRPSPPVSMARSLSSAPASITRPPSKAVTAEKPVAPGPEDCCMGGCKVCVWDLYGEEVDKYNRAAAEAGVAGMDADSIDPSVQAFRDLERKLANKDQ
ncbi:hypothetical protein BJ741DRAFT_243092 [Chytriomyces cf. hyalinus JEL632]|nr:hypothetical protein BJ741DRAFT_243092 [Chytriomyces cf. hyalinus JEL632]